MKAFLPINAKYWAKYAPMNGGGKVLIEEADAPFITHILGVYSVILNQAKRLTPVWLNCNIYPTENSQAIYCSYVANAESVEIKQPSFLKKIYMVIVAIIKYLIVYLKRDVLSFWYDGVKYGDIVYDVYLHSNCVATLRRIDWKILKLIYACINRHERVRSLLRSDDYRSVMVTHRIGIKSGVLMRAALRSGCNVYSTGGHQRSTVMLSNSLSEVYDYEYKPTLKDFDRLLSLPNEDINRMYESVHEMQVSGRGSLDAKYAFSEENRYYHDRSEFCHDYGLNPNKKNVFIMLHALTDYPHSHFRWMIFKDYYDWLKRTLDYCKTNRSVNWIFKQHPSIRFYPTKDISFDELFSGVPNNIVYISEKGQLDTRSLMYLADLVVTCLGSAGFELPAFAGIPSLTAADNPYSGFGFALEPKSVKQYLHILGQTQNIDKLSAEKQKRARIVYVYIHNISTVNMTAIPIISHEESRDKDIKRWFWGRVERLYHDHAVMINQEINSYIKKIQKDQFKNLNSMDEVMNDKNIAKVVSNYD